MDDWLGCCAQRAPANRNYFDDTHTHVRTTVYHVSIANRYGISSWECTRGRRDMSLSETFFFFPFLHTRKERKTDLFDFVSALRSRECLNKVISLRPPTSSPYPPQIKRKKDIHQSRVPYTNAIRYTSLPSSFVPLLSPVGLAFEFRKSTLY